MKTLATLCLFVLFVSAIGWSLPARAAVNVGDEPKLDFMSADGTPVSLSKLKGKLVVVDFWATWCGPCMAEAGHMVQINKTYQPKGLQMVGISLDANKGEMMSVAKQSGFAWPQYFDGLVWENKIGRAWGVTSIPRTFLIGPDGKVLWSGHAAQLDQQLEKAFKEHPPQLVDPKVLADAKAAVDRADSALKAGDTKLALQAMSKVPADARADKEFAARADEVRKTLEQAAESTLQDVEPLIQKSQYVEATARLRELSTGLDGTPTAAKAKKRLGELLAKPEVKAALAKAERTKQADAALAVAQQLKDQHKDEQAYSRFKGVATDFADIPAGATAAAVAKEYEKDPNFVKRATESAASTKASSALRVAQSYATAGRKDLARKKYQEVINEFPGTTYAEQAKKGLAALPK